MGLDMYLNGNKFYRHNHRKKEDGFEVYGLELRLGYWRKHPDLHGFIVRTFAGGRDDCQRIDLMTDDIRVILAAVKADDLPKTEGFFFGVSRDEDKAETITILERTIEWMETADPEAWRDVHYIASW